MHPPLEQNRWASALTAKDAVITGNKNKVKMQDLDMMSVYLTEKNQRTSLIDERGETHYCDQDDAAPIEIHFRNIRMASSGLVISQSLCRIALQLRRL